MNDIIGTVLFIDDEENSRFIYGALLEEIYGDQFFVETVEPGLTIESMIDFINKIDDVAAIVIDEKLQVGAGAAYKGSDLVQAIRGYDTKLPLYILTSEMGLIEPPFGSVEYIIDKSRIGEDAYKCECMKLMRRHVESFNDIKSSRMERFDFLLSKSLTEELTEAEIVEYNQLDLWRMKRVMVVEPLVVSKDLDDYESILNEIAGEIKRIKELN